MSNGQKNVKWSKRCQMVKKMSNGQKDVKYKKVKHMVKYKGHQNWSKILHVYILRVFGHHTMWHQNWHQYVWTSLCQFIFLWTSSIVHVFDFLTFDIFLTTCHHLTYCCPITCVTHYSWEQGVMWHIAIIMYRSRWGTGEMGYMGDGAHGQ